MRHLLTLILRIRLLSQHEPGVKDPFSDEYISPMVINGHKLDLFIIHAVLFWH